MSSINPHQLDLGEGDTSQPIKYRPGAAVLKIERYREFFSAVRECGQVTLSQETSTVSQPPDQSELKRDLVTNNGGAYGLRQSPWLSRKVNVTWSEAEQYLKLTRKEVAELKKIVPLQRWKLSKPKLKGKAMAKVRTKPTAARRHKRIPKTETVMLKHISPHKPKAKAKRSKEHLTKSQAADQPADTLSSELVQQKTLKRTAAEHAEYSTEKSKRARKDG